MRAYESREDAQSYKHRPNDRHKPENMLVRRPAVPEQADGNEHRARDHRW